jgi:hypothetical protein
VVSADAHAKVLKSKYNSREHAANQFRAKVRVVCTDEGAVPEFVRYSRPCFPVCDNSPCDVKLLEARMLKYFEEVVKAKKCKPVLVGLQHVILEIAASDDDDLTTTWHVSLDIASGRAGPLLPTQVP